MGNVKIYNNSGVLCDPCVQSIRIYKADGTLSPALKHGDKIYGTGGGLITIDCGSKIVRVQDVPVSTENVDCMGETFYSGYTVNRLIFTLTDSFGNAIVETTNTTVLFVLELHGCSGSVESFDMSVVIPADQSSASYDYTSMNYVDCGTSNSCLQEYMVFRTGSVSANNGYVQE